MSRIREEQIVSDDLFISEHPGLTGTDLHIPKVHATSHKTGGADSLQQAGQIVFFEDTAAVGTDKGYPSIFYWDGEGTLVMGNPVVRARTSLSDLTIDINKNGTSIFANATDQPIISTGTVATGTIGTAFISLAPGDYLEMDIDAMTGTPGEVFGIIPVKGFAL